MTSFSYHTSDDDHLISPFSLRKDLWLVIQSITGNFSKTRFFNPPSDLLIILSYQRRFAYGIIVKLDILSFFASFLKKRVEIEVLLSLELFPFRSLNSLSTLIIMFDGMTRV